MGRRDFVFATSIGTPLDSRNVTKAFQRILVTVGLPHQRFHDLRHACATLLLEDGEELGLVSRILGHSQIATTADVYAHLTPAMLERSAARMDAILAPDRRPLPADLWGTAGVPPGIKRPSGMPGESLSCVNWWPARRDSNPRPTDPKSVALIH